MHSRSRRAVATFFLVLTVLLAATLPAFADSAPGVSSNLPVRGQQTSSWFSIYSVGPVTMSHWISCSQANVEANANQHVWLIVNNVGPTPLTLRIAMGASPYYPATTYAHYYGSEPYRLADNLGEYETLTINPGYNVTIEQQLRSVGQNTLYSSVWVLWDGNYIRSERLRHQDTCE